MSDTKNKRYPGARPFRDSPLERKLFFGRKEEQKKLLHFILANSIVVLFAKSGVGKSSLLNAGVFEQMNKRDYFSVSIRLNTPKESILDSIESEIIEVSREKNVEYIPGKKDSLREFLNTAELWTEDDKLMTPVLVFDQFEEIFTLGYSEDQRQDFFKQLADLGKVKRKLSQSKGDNSSHYHLDSPPKVKIVFSLREEFLAQLEEISEDIPSILRNRFRLEALTEKQAVDAIEKPAELHDENLSSRKFNYSEGAIKAVTNFLIKKDLRERLKTMTKTWDLKWPRRPMLIFAVLLIPLTFLLNYLGNELGDIILYVVLWLVFPIFFFTLAIIKPIAGRNTIAPILLLYSWFYILIFVLYNSKKFLATLELFIMPTIVVIVMVLLICRMYRKGRTEMLNQSGPISTEIDFKNKKWPRRPLLVLFSWIIGSTIFAVFARISVEVVFLNILVIQIYFIVLSTKFPIPPRKHAILPIAGAHFLNSLMIFLHAIYEGVVDIKWYVFLGFFILITLYNIIYLASLWWSYFKGLKSVDPELFEILGKSKEKIEPFQLQLLCQNIEDKVLLKQGKHGSGELITITEKDFGGDLGMRRILLKFYDDQLKKVSWKFRGKVRQLCERGLISQSGRRLSIAEDEIINRFNLKKETLFDLIQYRLLRAEPRLGNKYYEISHDTLVQPILTSAKKHINKDIMLKWVGMVIGLILLVIGFNFYNSLTHPSNQEIYERMDEVIQSGTTIHIDKINNLDYNLNQLDKRDKLKWLLNSIEKTDYKHKNSKEYYKTKLKNLNSINSSLIELNEIKFVDNAGKIMNRYYVYPGSTYVRFSIFPSKDKSKVKSHNLEIEWHYKPYNDYGYSKWRQKFKMNPVSTDERTSSFDISELFVRSRNELRFYESDSVDPSKRYLLKRHYFEVRLPVIQDSMIPKYSAYKGFRELYYRRNYRKALISLTTAIEFDANYALAYYWRGIAHEAMDNDELAWSDYLWAYRKDPSLWPALEKILGRPINKISNGSFELPEVPATNYLLTSELGRESSDTLKGPSWVNESGINFDLKSTNLGHGEAKDGNQFIELAGKIKSWISQKIITEIGMDYIISFSFSPRPGEDSEDNKMEIRWNGEAIDTVQADGGRKNSKTKWETYFYDVTATSGSSYLEFRDVGDSIGGKAGTGPYLDAVLLFKKQDN